MNEETQESVYYGEGLVKDTTCDHYYIEDSEQDPNTNLVSVRCMNDGCWHGIMIDPSKITISDGKLTYK